MPERKCENCEWWKKLLCNNAGLGQKGECRRFPPRKATQHYGNNLVDVPPVTYANNRCGEFKEKQ